MAPKIFKPSKSYITRSSKDLADVMKRLDDKKDKKDDRNDDRSVIKNHILEFAKKNSIMVYGGTAIDHYLPEGEKIYTELDITDVDMMTPDSECFARALAAELDDIGIKYVESRESRVHNKTYTIKGMEVGTLADISLTRKDSIRCMRKFQLPEHRPYAPIEYLLYAMHFEFATTKRGPRRWEKMFPRYVKLLTAVPFQCDFDAMNSLLTPPMLEGGRMGNNKHRRHRHDRPPSNNTVGISNNTVGNANAQEVPTKPTKITKAQILSVLADMRTGDGKARPAIGLHAVQEYSRVYSPGVLSPGYHHSMAMVEVLSLSPQADAIEFMRLMPGLYIGRNTIENAEKFEGSLRDNECTISEILLRDVDSKQPIVSFIAMSTCFYHVEDIGGIETVISFLYRRLIFGPPAPPELLRGLIGVLYSVSFDSKKLTLKDKARLRVFDLDNCIGKDPTYNELIVDKFEKNNTLRAYWPWKPEDRARRQRESRNSSARKCDG